MGKEAIQGRGVGTAPAQKGPDLAGCRCSARKAVEEPQYPRRYPCRHPVRLPREKGPVGGIGQEAHLQDHRGRGGIDGMLQAPVVEGVVLEHVLGDSLGTLTEPGCRLILGANGAEQGVVRTAAARTCRIG